jgi:hypothetical protein
VAPRTLLSEGAVKVSELNGKGHRHHQPFPVRVSVAAAPSEANKATANNLACHLAVQGPGRHEAEKSADNLAQSNLQLRHLPVRVRAKPDGDERPGKVPKVSLLGSQRVERKLHPSAVRDNRSVERKRKRGLQRRGRNYLVNFRGGSRARKFRSRFVLNPQL